MENFSLRKEYSKLITMPFFWVRFISLSLFLAGDDLVRLFFSVGSAIPIAAISVFAPIIFISLLVFTIFEIKSLKFVNITYKAYRTPLFLLWLFFSLMCIASEIINGWVLYSIGILIFMPAFVIMVQERRFCTLFLISCIPTLICDLGISTFLYPYRGNMISLSYAAMIPIILCALAWILLNTKKSHNYLIAILIFEIILILYFTNISGGRTGFASMIFTIICFIIAISVKFHAAKKKIEYHYSTIAFFSLLAIILFTVLVSSGIILLDSRSIVPDVTESIEGKSIFEKFSIALTNGNPFSNRGMIWKYTLSNANIFGHSPSFYLNSSLLTPDQNQAHNTFLAVLGHYGIVAFVSYLLFCVCALIRSIRYALSSRRLYLFPFIVLIAFFSTGIAEDILIMWGPHLFTFLFYCASAFIIVTEQKEHDI